MVFLFGDSLFGADVSGSGYGAPAVGYGAPEGATDHSEELTNHKLLIEDLWFHQPTDTINPKKYYNIQDE